MVWEDHEFPVVDCDGDRLLEALHSLPGSLLHLHEDHEARYPRAAVRHQQQDLDPPENSLLEQRGIMLGSHPRRFPAGGTASVLADKRSADEPTKHV